MDYFGHPSKAYVGTMVAILEIGAFITSLMVGRIGDIIGRRRTIFMRILYRRCTPDTGHFYAYDDGWSFRCRFRCRCALNYRTRLPV